jgi:P-type E1-E2 ATPase
MAGVAFVLSGDITRVLAVLVIATPCPLIIAAPVAFIGGLSHAARHRIIVKSPAVLEVLARAKTILFDKTGTLTIGSPQLIETIVLDPAYDAPHVLSLAAAVEFHSIHPLARAIGAARDAARLPIMTARDVEEKIGYGIVGIVGDQRYSVCAAPPDSKGGILLSFSDNAHEIARFRFEDVIKEETAMLISWLLKNGMHVEILTGDTQENAERTLGRFNIPIRAKATPQYKSDAVDYARMQGPVIMVGDGLNDAPALAHADVGIVFSGTENSATIDAASVAILGNDAGLIRELIEDARRTTAIAEESTWGGIMLSVVGMVFAASGNLAPVTGALLQELIDVAVILNALRTAVSHEYHSMS